MSPLRAESRTLARLAFPVVVANLGTMLMGAIDTAMVGRVGVDALAAVSIGNVWVHGTFLFIQGVLFGLDPIVAQAHGAGDGRRCGLALQRGLVLAGWLSLLLGGLWLLAGPFLTLAEQEPALVDAAHRYVLVQIPSVPFILLFVAMRQYLQGREIMRPAMWVVLAANLFNALANWALIFGHLGFPALGVVGAGLATALTRVILFGLLLAMIRGFDLHAGAWQPWSRAAASWQGLRKVLAYGVPIAATVGFEIWAFGASTLLSGWIDPVAVAAHTVTLNLAALAFMFPLGISQGAATRVGNLLGASQHAAAQRAAWVAVGMGASVMAGFAALFVLLRQQLPAIFARDPEILSTSAAILPIAAAFAIFDGTQVVGCGVLRGMGDTRPAAVYNLVGYWLLGLPIGGWLALRGGWGLAGIWWGLALGLAVVAALLVARLRVRGPAHLVTGPSSP